QNTLQRIFTHFICILIHIESLNQCKFACRGFLANGGILERCRLKVNFSPVFFLLFYATAPFYWI
ncbi:hypothetical protein, partial [Kosakonia sacchari]|uniref:hypothetical protein n=1 Tax=Kosakonia sacchari TaxID=1158459 RepID=UPI0028A902FF